MSLRAGRHLLHGQVVCASLMATGRQESGQVCRSQGLALSSAEFSSSLCVPFPTLLTVSTTSQVYGTANRATPHWTCLLALACCARCALTLTFENYSWPPKRSHREPSTILTHRVPMSASGRHSSSSSNNTLIFLLLDRQLENVICVDLYGGHMLPQLNPPN